MPLNKKIDESDNDFKVYIYPNTISMKSVLTTSHHIHFNSRLNFLLGFTLKDYPPGIHTSEKPVIITTTDKVHLKCDCVDGSIVYGFRERSLSSFNLSAHPGYKIIKEPTTVLYKKRNKTRLDTIQFFLADSNHNRQQSLFQRGDINIHNSNYQDLILKNIMNFFPYN